MRESREEQERIDRQVFEDLQRHERAAAFQQMQTVGDARQQRQWDWDRAAWSEEYEQRRHRERLEEQDAMLAEHRRHIESLIPDHEAARRHEWDDRRRAEMSTTAYQREHRRQIENEEHQRQIANWSTQQHEDERRARERAMNEASAEATARTRRIRDEVVARLTRERQLLPPWRPTLSTPQPEVTHPYWVDRADREWDNSSGWNDWSAWHGWPAEPQDSWEHQDPSMNYTGQEADDTSMNWWDARHDERTYPSRDNRPTPGASSSSGGKGKGKGKRT